MERLRKFGILAGVLLTFCFGLHGQPGAGDPNQGRKPGEAPISGIGILLALGGLLGAKKVFDTRKKN